MRLAVNNEMVAHTLTYTKNDLFNEGYIGVHSGSMSLGFIYGMKDDPVNVALYSYSTPIAIRDIEKNVYLRSTRGYSNTTAKHQNYLWNATRGQNCIDIYDVNQSTHDNIQSFFSAVEFMCDKQTRARKANYHTQILHTLKELNKYAEYIEIDKRSKEYKHIKKLTELSADFEKFSLLISYVLKHNEAQRKANERAIAQKKRELKKVREQFTNDTTLPYIAKLCTDYVHTFMNQEKNKEDYYEVRARFTKVQSDCYLYKAHALTAYMAQYKDLLRVTAKCNVITSQRVTMSKKDALLLYRAITQNKLKINDIVLGHYTVKEIHSNYIVIGCHTLSLETIKAVYEQLTACNE